MENPNCELAAFYDLVPGRAEEFARRFGGRAYGSVDELLASGVDAVSVCTANTSHAAMAIQALRAGKHVLCEKPMATTLADCEAMAGRRAGKRQIPDDRPEPAPCKSTCRGKENTGQRRSGHACYF